MHVRRFKTEKMNERTTTRRNNRGKKTGQHIQVLIMQWIAFNNFSALRPRRPHRHHRHRWCFFQANVFYQHCDAWKLLKTLEWRTICHKYHILAAFELNSSTMFFNHFHLKELFLFIEKFLWTFKPYRHIRRNSCNLLKQRICSIFTLLTVILVLVGAIQVVRWWNGLGGLMGCGRTMGERERCRGWADRRMVKWGYGKTQNR